MRKVVLSLCKEYEKQMGNWNVYYVAHFCLGTMNPAGRGQELPTPQDFADSLSRCLTKLLENGQEHVSATVNTRQGFAFGTVAPASG